MNGILLYGPSGVGKTLIAEAAANVSNRAVFRIRGPEIFSRSSSIYKSNPFLLIFS